MFYKSHLLFFCDISNITKNSKFYLRKNSHIFKLVISSQIYLLFFGIFSECNNKKKLLFYNFKKWFCTQKNILVLKSNRVSFILSIGKKFNYTVGIITHSVSTKCHFITFNINFLWELPPRNTLIPLTPKISHYKWELKQN